MLDKQVLSTLARLKWSTQFHASMVLVCLRTPQDSRQAVDTEKEEAKHNMNFLMAIVNRPVPEKEVLDHMGMEEMGQHMETLVARAIARLLILELDAEERELLEIPECFR